jgi:hypothetical protein
MAVQAVKLILSQELIDREYTPVELSTGNAELDEIVPDAPV